MTDLNELFKVIAEGKKQYEDTDPIGQQIKQAKEHVKEDLSSLFSQLSSLKEDLEKELVVEEAKLVSLIDSDSIKRDAKNIVNEVFGQIKTPIITEEIPAQPIIHTPEVRAKQVDADVDKYLTDKSFQQPNPDLVTKNIDDIRNKIKFLEQAIGRVAAAGPGGGEVNLRYLDDVDRSTITDGWYLRYSATKKKFEFAEVISSGGNGATGVTGSSGAQGASGLNGSTGPSGASGSNGIDGATGISGASGVNGSTGLTGASGTNGASGIQGASGSTGLTGATGIQGASGISGASGSTGITGASGAQGASGVGATGVGATGLTGATGNSVAASYLKYTRSAAQTSGLTAGSRVICNVSESTAGSDITIDTNSGAITLAANKTYRLRGAVPNFITASSSPRPSFCWYNEATSAYIGEASFHYTGNDGAGYGAGGGMSEAIITTSSSTVVSFRILSVNAAITGLGGSTDFSTTGSYPWVDVEVISGNSPLLNGATGATGPGMTYASGFVNAGVDVTLGNLKARFSTSGNRSLQLSTVSGTYSVYGSSVYSTNGANGTTIDAASPRAISTTPAYINAGYNFPTAGGTDTWMLMDTSNAIAWRISLIVGGSYNNNFISIERLI